MRAMRSLLLVGAAALVPPQRTTQKATIHRASEKSTLTEAGEYEAVAIRAEFPEDLRGTLYRLGPGGALRRGQERDPYGFCLGVTFTGDGSCVARARYVRTEAFLRDRRGMPEGSPLAERNVGKKLLYWADRLFALTDGCKPYMVDPLSLGTQKKSELGGLLKEADDGFDEGVRCNGDGTKLCQAFFDKGLPFIGGDCIEWRDFDSDFRASGVVAKLPLPKGVALKTWAPTPTGFVCVLSDNSVTILKRGNDAGNEVGRIAGLTHIINARDAPGGAELDAVVDGRLTRITSSLATEPLSEHAVTEATPLGDDFLVNTAVGGLVLVRDGREAASYAAPDRRAGAPTKSGAYVLCLLHGADATEVAALRAADLAEVARAPLPHACGGGAGPFVAGVAPTLDEIRSAETLARLYARKASEWNEVDGGFSGLGIKSFLFPKGVSGG